MFSLQQIKDAHSRVKSGADFPLYIQELKKLGIIYYESYVIDGHTEYYGINNYNITSLPKYDTLIINRNANTKQFISDLTAHQQGKTDYQTFCNDCAKSGIEKWVVSIQEMTCTYYDKDGNKVLVETIPEI